MCIFKGKAVIKMNVKNVQETDLKKYNMKELLLLSPSSL